MIQGERGVSLVEVLLALLILGIVLAGMVPSFLAFLDVNTRNEERTGAVQAAQTVLESLRLADPAMLPSGGASQPQPIRVGERTYQVVTRYCVVSAFCDSDSRHLAVEVLHEGNLLYSAETVFTQLR
jgi:prepilin-type N-terminal cleavage/methylation domain-containing protein